MYLVQTLPVKIQRHETFPVLLISIGVQKETPFGGVSQADVHTSFGRLEHKLVTDALTELTYLHDKLVLLEGGGCVDEGVGGGRPDTSKSKL